jgi:hypothetical protein
MPYLERFKQSYLKERFSQFPDEINDIIDLLNLFSMHNVFPMTKDNINVYESNIEVFGLGGNEKLEEYPYFNGNFFIIHMPYVNSNGKSVLEVEFIDYNETAQDKKERNQVKRHLQDVLPFCINVDKIVYKVRN